MFSSKQFQISIFKYQRVYRQRVKRQSPPPVRNFSQELGNVVRYDLLEIRILITCDQS